MSAMSDGDSITFVSSIPGFAFGGAAGVPRIAPTSTPRPAKQPAKPSKPRRQPCIHLGQIVAECPNGHEALHVHVCESDKPEWSRCWTSGNQSTDADIGSCRRCPHYERKTPTAQPPAPATPTTIAITHWQRPAALERLLASITKHLPGYPVEIEDTGGNLSAGRNRLYARVQTPYLVVMEEDFVAGPHTAKGIREAIAVLDHDQAIAAVGGTCIEPVRGRRHWGHNYVMRGKLCEAVPSQRPMRKTPGGIAYRPCDLILNWGVFRRDLFQRVPWDEAFEITEHKEYYYRASRTNEFAYLAHLTIQHLRDRPNPTYNRARNRSFLRLIPKKHGFQFLHGV